MSNVPLASPFLPSAAAIKTAPVAPEKITGPLNDPLLKEIDNPQRIQRAKDLLYTDTMQEYVYKQTIQIPKSKDSRDIIPLKLEFNFNIDSLLNKCISQLRHAGISVKEKVFKGGAIHYVMDGYPKTLRDFDISLVIDPPKGDPIEQWKKINAIILGCIEDEAGLTRFEMGSSITYTSSKKKISLEMPIIPTRNGIPKISLFEHPGGLQNFWWWGRKREVREEGEEYSIFAIPALPYRIELEIVASHKNSATCSLDALRLHYEETDGLDGTKIWMTAVDGYDVHRACRLRRKRLFYCIPENIPSIREGLFRYCSHLLKGYLPEELAYETAFCKAFFSSEASGKQFSDNLQDYLLKHTSSKEDRVRYLLNMDAIIDRYKEIKEEDKLPTRTSIAQTLLKELGLEKTTQNPAELIREMQQMRDYLYLVFSKNCIFHSYKNREFCYLDDPRGREFGSFVLEPPKDEALKQYLDCTLKDCESLQKLSLLFPHPDKSVESFFRNILSPKFLTKTETKTTPPSSFPSFAAFLTYRKEQLKMPPKACTKYLKDLFSFKAESLKTLNSDQIADLKALLSETFPLLKGKERSLAGSLFIEIIKNQVWSIDESASKAKELIQSLLNPFSPKEFKEALTIYSQLAGSVELPFKHSNELLRLLLETSAHPKEALLLLGQIPFDCKNGDEHCATWMTAIKKIQSKDEFHSQLMTFWKVWTECYKRCKPEETARLDLEINALAERTLDILKKSKHEDALYWASQIASITNLPSLAPLQKECHELISRWMELGGSRVVSFYMKSEHEILDKERERLFTPLFSSFLQAVFPIKNNIEQVVAVIKRGVEQVINREMPLENANCIQDCLEKPSRNKGFPQQLIASQVALRRYIKSKKTEEKFSPATFSQLKKLFIEKKDFASFEKCYDLLRLLIQSPSPDSASLFAEGLDLFEKTLVILQKSNDKNLIDFFPRLQDLLLMHQKWTDSEREKINNGIQTYTKLVASRKVSAASILEDIRTLIEDLDKAKCQKLKNISEERLKKNPEGDAQTWGTLLCCYKILNDPINIIRCSEKFLPFTTSPEDKYKAIQHKYGAYSTLGEVDKMIVSAQEVLKLNQDWQCYGALGLAYYYAHNWSLAIDNFRIANGMLEKDFCKEDGLLATQKNAELGLNSKLTELAMLVEKDMKAASLLSFALINSQSVVLYSNMSEEETPVGICRKQIVAEINKEYSLHVELLIQQQKWDQAKSILNAQQLLLTTQAEIAFNRFKYGLCNIQSNDWREGITLVIKNYMDSPSTEKRANLWTLIGQFIRVYKLLPPSEVAEIREKLKEIIGIMLFIPKNLEKELKVFFLYQEDEEVSWMDSTAPNFSQEIY